MSKDSRELGVRNKKDEWKYDAKNSSVRRRIKRVSNKTGRQLEKILINKGFFE